MGLHNALATPHGPLRSKISLSVVLLTIAPVVLPAAYMAYVARTSLQQVTASTSISPLDAVMSKRKSKSSSSSSSSKARGATLTPEKGDSDIDTDTLAIPPSVLAVADRYVVARERVVSNPVPLSRILPGLQVHGLLSHGEGTAEEASSERKQKLLDTYLATTMRMFAWTPQAFIMKYLVSRLPGGTALAATFSASYLDVCTFEAGDRVCGVYVVRQRVESKDGERVFLDLSPPDGWTGPVVTGVLDCGIVVEKEKGRGKGKGDETFVRFVNETVLWRRRDAGPTLLEGKISRWFHTAMVAWMMGKGVEVVTEQDKDDSARVREV